MESVCSMYPIGGLLKFQEGFQEFQRANWRAGFFGSGLRFIDGTREKSIVFR